MLQSAPATSASAVSNKGCRPLGAWLLAAATVGAIGALGPTAHADPADDDRTVPDDEFDFGDVDTDSAVAAPAPAPSPLRIGGFVRSDWAVWTERLDDNAFAKARHSLDLWVRYKTGPVRFQVAGHAEYDLAYRHDRGGYTDATLDAYEWLLDTREVLAAASMGSVELTVGRQIVPWGVGKLISPVDVVNPRDQREPGLTQLADVRLPVLATRIAYFVGDSRFELMAVHEAWFGYRPPPLAPFSPLVPVLPPGAPERFDDVPERSDVDAQQVFARWVRAAPGLDLAVYVASTSTSSARSARQLRVPTRSSSVTGGTPWWATRVPFQCHTGSCSGS